MAVIAETSSANHSVSVETCIRAGSLRRSPGCKWGTGHPLPCIRHGHIGCRDAPYKPSACPGSACSLSASCHPIGRDPPLLHQISDAILADLSLDRIIRALGFKFGKLLSAPADDAGDAPTRQGALTHSLHEPKDGRSGAGIRVPASSPRGFAVARDSATIRGWRSSIPMALRWVPASLPSSERHAGDVRV